MKQKIISITGILVLLILVSAPVTWGQKISGTATDVKKGDIIIILHKGNTLKINLYGITCPEVMEPYGRRAQQFTSQAVLNKSVIVDVHKRQSDTEYTGVVSLPDGTVLNQQLLKKGLARWDRNNAPDDIKFQSFQSLAKGMKMGIWAHSSSLDTDQSRDTSHPSGRPVKPEKAQVSTQKKSSGPFSLTTSILSSVLIVLLLAFLFLAFRYRKVIKQLGPQQLELSPPLPESELSPMKKTTGEGPQPDTQQAEEAIEVSRQTIKSLLSNLSDFVSGLVEDNASYNDKMKDHKTSIKQAMTKAGMEEISRLLILEIDNMQTNSSQFRTQLEQANTTINEQKKVMEEIQLDAKLDFLTKLANRRAFDENLKEELERTKRYGGTFSLAMLDIDFFKNVNDKYGHLAGDKTLQLVAKLMKEQTRTNDSVGRFGGEEFAILLPQTPVDNARIVAEKIRQKVQSNVLVHDGNKIKITISAGVGEVALPSDTMEDFIARVDAALYLAKESGRNQVKLATPPNQSSRET